MSRVSLGTNIASSQAIRRLGVATSELSAIFQRLGSGQRINRASDDAAGLAIVSNLSKNARVYTQAIRNGNDAVSALSIAEGGLSQATSMLIRLRELAAQSANGTFSRFQRLALDAEGEALTDEFNRLVATTEFNGLKLLGGQLGRTSIQLGFGTDGTIGFELGAGLNRKIRSGYTETLLSPNSGQNGGAAGDFNNDGYDDLVYLDSSGVNISYGSSNGLSNGVVLDASTGTSIAAGDINGDGKLDIVFGSGSNLRILTQGNNQSYSLSSIVGFGNVSSFIKLADFNGDGRMDIAGHSGGANILYATANSSGGFNTASTLALTGNRGEIEFGDVDGDGRLDLISGSSNVATISISLGNSAGAFGAASTLATSATNSSIALGDFNYDGTLDIAAGSLANSTIRIYSGSGNGSFSLLNTISSTGASKYLEAVDVDGDGKLDLINSSDSNTIKTFLGNGDGGFTASLTGSYGALAQSGLLSGDFNGDGVQDLVILDQLVDSISIAYANTQNSTTLQRMNFTSRDGAVAAFSVIDAALLRVQKELGGIGANQSRIFSALNTLAASRENSELSASRIKDADIAAETARLTRFQILQQASASVLAQANQQPALALRLLNV